MKACGAFELLLVQLLSLSPPLGLVPGAFSEQQPTAGFRMSVRFAEVFIH